MKQPFNKSNELKNTFKTKERVYALVIAVLSVIVIFFCVNFFFFNQDTQGITRSQFLNPSLGILEKQNLIVDFQELRELLTNKYENRNDYMISIYFEYFPTGANISINKDERVWPASLIKIPVAMAMMKKVQDKVWTLENELVILDEDKDSEYGDMYKEQTGTTYTIKKLLEKSLIDSDNTAHFILLRNLDGKELEDVYVHLGMDDVINALKLSPSKKDETDNRITAKRYSIFFRSLYNASFLDQHHSELFLEILSNAPKDLLGQGLPDFIPFVHKTGIRIDEAVRADSGIVYVPGRPYLLTVMIQKKGTKQINDAEIKELFRQIGTEVYSYVTNAR